MIAVILLAFVVSGCSKKGDAAPSGSSTWTFEGTTYKSTAASFANTYLGAGATGSYIEVGFSVVPTTSGTYTVVDDESDTVGANQCSIDLSQTDRTAYVSNAGGSATVTVSGGKVSVKFSNIIMGRVNGTTGQASTTISGTVSQ